MRHDSCRHAYRDTLRTGEQNDGKLGPERYRFPISSVVRRNVGGYIRIVEQILRERSRATFDIPRRGRGISGNHVSEISLSVYEQFLVGQDHKCIAD